jgi:hypothetical protein
MITTRPCTASMVVRSLLGIVFGAMVGVRVALTAHARNASAAKWLTDTGGEPKGQQWGWGIRSGRREKEEEDADDDTGHSAKRVRQ